MTYDPVDTNDDGVVEADVDNESVNTEQATATDVLEGDGLSVSNAPSDPTIMRTYESAYGQIIYKTQITADNSPQTFYDEAWLSGVPAVNVGRFKVIGSSPDNFNYFVDDATFAIGDYQITSLGSAPARTYSRDGGTDTHNITLDDNSNTYDILVTVSAASLTEVRGL